MYPPPSPCPGPAGDAAAPPGPTHTITHARNSQHQLQQTLHNNGDNAYNHVHPYQASHGEHTMDMNISPMPAHSSPRGSSLAVHSATSYHNQHSISSHSLTHSRSPHPFTHSTPYLSGPPLPVVEVTTATLIAEPTHTPPNAAAHAQTRKLQLAKHTHNNNNTTSFQPIQQQQQQQEQQQQQQQQPYSDGDVFAGSDVYTLSGPSLSFPSNFTLPYPSLPVVLPSTPASSNSASTPPSPNNRNNIVPHTYPLPANTVSAAHVSLPQQPHSLSAHNYSSAHEFMSHNQPSAGNYHTAVASHHTYSHSDSSPVSAWSSSTLLSLPASGSLDVDGARSLQHTYAQPYASALPQTSSSNQSAHHINTRYEQHEQVHVPYEHESIDKPHSEMSAQALIHALSNDQATFTQSQRLELLKQMQRLQQYEQAELMKRSQQHSTASPSSIPFRVPPLVDRRVQSMSVPHSPALAATPHHSLHINQMGHNNHFRTQSFESHTAPTSVPVAALPSSAPSQFRSISTSIFAPQTSAPSTTINSQQLLEQRTISRECTQIHANNQSQQFLTTTPSTDVPSLAAHPSSVSSLIDCRMCCKSIESASVLLCRNRMNQTNTEAPCDSAYCFDCVDILQTLDSQEFVLRFVAHLNAQHFLCPSCLIKCTCTDCQSINYSLHQSAQVKQAPALHANQTYMQDQPLIQRAQTDTSVYTHSHPNQLNTASLNSQLLTTNPSEHMPLLVLPETPVQSHRSSTMPTTSIDTGSRRARSIAIPSTLTNSPGKRRKLSNPAAEITPLPCSVSNTFNLLANTERAVESDSSSSLPFIQPVDLSALINAVNTSIAHQSFERGFQQTGLSSDTANLHTPLSHSTKIMSAQTNDHSASPHTSQCHRYNTRSTVTLNEHRSTPISGSSVGREFSQPSSITLNDDSLQAMSRSQVTPVQQSTNDSNHNVAFDTVGTNINHSIASSHPTFGDHVSQVDPHSDGCDAHVYQSVAVMPRLFNDVPFTLFESSSQSSNSQVSLSNDKSDEVQSSAMPAASSSTSINSSSLHRNSLLPLDKWLLTQAADDQVQMARISPTIQFSLLSSDSSVSSSPSSQLFDERLLHSYPVSSLVPSTPADPLTVSSTSDDIYDEQEQSQLTTQNSKPH